MKPFATSSNLSERIIVQEKSDTPTQWGALVSSGVSIGLERIL